VKKSIAWGLTGAGALLKESVETIKELVSLGFKITAYVSKAGETVLSAYGLKGELERTLVGEYPVGVVYESAEPPGFPSAGRLYLGMYSYVVISPATMNTVSKIVNGIADTLVSTLAMHAIKTGKPLLVLPVDAYEVKSLIPVFIDRSKCEQCSSCLAALKCPAGALKEHPVFKVAIDISRCNRCYSCLEGCPRGAIVFDYEIVVRPVPYYVEIINKLRGIPGVKVIEHPKQVLSLVSLREPN